MLRENEVIGVSRKNEDQEYVEASTSAATVLPGVPLPVWTHLGEPEPEPIPEPEPAPVPEPASVMELVSVGAAAASTDYLQSGSSDLGASSAPVAMTAPPVSAPPMPAPPVSAPPMPAPPLPAGLVSVSGVTVPDSLDAFAPPAALVAPAPVEPVAAPAPAELSAPSFAAPAPMAAPPAAFAPPVAAPAVDVPVLARPMPAPDLLVAAPPVPAMPAPVTSAPVMPPPVAFGTAPLLFSAPAPLAAPVVDIAPPAPEVHADSALVAVPPLEAVVPETAPVFDPAAELTAVDAPDASDQADSDEAGKSRRPLVLLLVLGIVAILAAVAAFVYPGLLVAQDDPAPVAPVSQPQAAAKTATLGVPATVAGLDKLTGAPATALSAAAGSTTLSGFSTPVSAVYGKDGVPGATVIAWTAAPSSPSANIAAAFAGFETASSTAIANIAEVPVTGGLTGQMSCGSGTVNAAPATICFWADDTTFGAVTILKPVSAKDGALTAVAVRQAVETLA